MHANLSIVMQPFTLPFGCVLIPINPLKRPPFHTTHLKRSTSAPMTSHHTDNESSSLSPITLKRDLMSERDITRSKRGEKDGIQKG